MMIEMSYLKAIQKIPGETASEKLRWLGKVSQDQQKEEQKASGDIDKVPPELQPILRVQTAVKKKIHRDITSALKSDDVTIVRRALQASWFFDGSHKDVVDEKYFREQIFPYVSMNTRLYIIKTLAHRLKDPQFAQQMFTEVEYNYGTQCALPLLVVCDEEFAYRTIVDKKIQLPFTIAKKFFRRNIDFIVRYLRLSDPSVKNSFRVNIRAYYDFFPTLLKKRLTAFVELYEMHETSPLRISLSNTCINTFLKTGLGYLMKKPKLYIDNIVPLVKIHESIIEEIFPVLIPEKVEKFHVELALKHLKYYPESKKFDLLTKVYRDKYGVEFFARLENVGLNVLLLAPAEVRVKQARIMIMKELKKDITERKKIMETPITSSDDDSIIAVMFWVSYLSVEESISCIKRAMYKATSLDSRISLLQRMIITCSVNKDEDALLDFLKYFLNRHKNEGEKVFNEVLEEIVSLYDVPHLNEKIWSALNEIIVLFYVKYGWVTEKMLVVLIHYRLLHNMTITKEVEMLLDTQTKKTYVNFEHIFEKHLDYKRQYLSICTEVLEEKCNIEKWKKNKIGLVFSLVQAMYGFNEKLDKEKKKLTQKANISYTNIKPLTIKDYPWLMRTLYQEVIQTDHFYKMQIKDLFRKHELELYDSWFQEKEEFHIETWMRTGEALKSLKQNPQKILDNWKEYLKVCVEYKHDKSIHRFVRATRWYQNLPIWFVEYCQENWQQENNCNYLVIMALLLHGDTIGKIVEPLIPTETTVNIADNDARDKYSFVSTLPLVMKVSNPPIPLELIGRLCEGDYLSVALMALMCACRRSPLPKVMSFAEELSDKRVSVTKHGIRIMFLLAPIQQLHCFLLSLWEKKKHHSIRQVLLKNTKELFHKNPTKDNWSLYKSLISSMTVADDSLFSELNNYGIPAEYVVDYIETLFDLMHKLLDQGLHFDKAYFKILDIVQMMIEEVVCDNLKNSLIKLLLEKYLFHRNQKLTTAVTNFTISPYLLRAKDMYITRLDTFSKIFKKKVKEGWNKSHPQKSGFYPLNNNVYNFVNHFVLRVFYTDKHQVDRRQQLIVTKMLEIFLSSLTPLNDPRCYLLLVFTLERTNCTSPKEFGMQIGKKMPNLTKLYSDMFVPFINNILKKLPLYSTFKDSSESGKDPTEDREEVMYQFVEGLIEARNIQSYFTAADFLLKELPSCNSKHCILIKRLMDLNATVITCILNDGRNQICLKKNPFSYEYKSTSSRAKDTDDQDADDKVADQK